MRAHAIDDHEKVPFRVLKRESAREEGDTGAAFNVTFQEGIANRDAIDLRDGDEQQVDILRDGKRAGAGRGGFMAVRGRGGVGALAGGGDVVVEVDGQRVVEGLRRERRVGAGVREEPVGDEGALIRHPQGGDELVLADVEQRVLGRDRKRHALVRGRRQAAVAGGVAHGAGRRRGGEGGGCGATQAGERGGGGGGGVWETQTGGWRCGGA